MINVKNLKKLGSGSASDAYLLDDGKVIIVGKREDCFSNYQMLYQKSNMIAGKITTINYPKIHQLISPCKEFPFGAMIEDYVPGSELRGKAVQLSMSDKVEIGKNLGLFLSQLHKIKTNGNKEEEISINLKKFDRSILLLKEHLPKETIEKLMVIKNQYHLLMQSKEFCITHGDLNAGNIMISEDNKLSGIIDFGNMEFYIPEIEFAHMYFFDRQIYDSMIKNYDKEINEEEIILLELVINVRHFKNIVNFEEKRNKCLQTIEGILEHIFSESEANY